MILLIAACCGPASVTAVIGIAGANVAMVLFGWLQEAMNPPGRGWPVLVDLVGSDRVL